MVRIKGKKITNLKFNGNELQEVVVTREEYKLIIKSRLNNKLENFNILISNLEYELLVSHQIKDNVYIEETVKEFFNKNIAKWTSMKLVTIKEFNDSIPVILYDVTPQEMNKMLFKYCDELGILFESGKQRKIGKKDYKCKFFERKVNLETLSEL